MSRTVLDFSRRRTVKLLGSTSPDTEAGAPENLILTMGLYRFSSTGPYVLDAGSVQPTGESFFADDVNPIEVAWHGGPLTLASLSGKPVHVDIVPLIEVSA